MYLIRLVLPIILAWVCTPSHQQDNINIDNDNNNITIIHSNSNNTLVARVLPAGMIQCGAAEHCFSANQTCDTTTTPNRCQCNKKGYKTKMRSSTRGHTSSTGHLCQDINECTDGSLNDCSHTCINLPGYFVCVCPDGFVANPDHEPHKCHDQDECAHFPKCDDCINTPGSFYCKKCVKGYTVMNKTYCVKDPPKPMLSAAAITLIVLMFIIAIIVDILMCFLNKLVCRWCGRNYK